MPGFPNYRLDPEFMLVVVLPLLLYAATYTTSLPAFRANLRPIVLMSVGYTLFGTVAVGYVAYLVIPELPLAAVLVLGALVAPPDAVAAVVGGSTGFLSASGRFLLASAGGLVIGAVAAVLLGWIRRRVESPMSHTALSLVAPFVAYVPAEEVGASGLVSVVVAGLYLGRHSPRLMDAQARLVARSVWRVIEYVLVGVVFALIGLRLPDVLVGLEAYPPGLLAAAAVAVLAAVVVGRFLWVFPAVYLLPLLSRSCRDGDPAPPWQLPALGDARRRPQPRPHDARRGPARRRGVPRGAARAGSRRVVAAARLMRGDGVRREGGGGVRRSRTRGRAPVPRLDLVSESLAVARGGRIDFVRPREPMDLLYEQNTAEGEEYPPYWAELWPSGIELARAVSDRELRGARVLELGCGLGLPSIAAALAGGRVLATDRSPDAVAFTAVNARRSGALVDTAVCTWDRPDLLVDRGPWHLVLAADVLYGHRNVHELLELLPRLVHGSGEVWIADPGRPLVADFLARARSTWRSVSTVGTRVPAVQIHRLRSLTPAPGPRG